MGMVEIPALVNRDIERAVASAIQFGVGADDFRRFVRQAWANEMREKARRDDKVMAASNEGERDNG